MNKNSIDKIEKSKKLTKILIKIIVVLSLLSFTAIIVVFADKKPKETETEYTWDEYIMLSEDEQKSFLEQFETNEELNKWLNYVIIQDYSGLADLPWETEGNKQPNQYSWNEFLKLTSSQQEAFFEWFDDSKKFIDWQLNAQYNQEILPWETEGNKQPNEYTWQEFESLTDIQQEKFFEWFENSDDFNDWMNSAKES